MRKNPFKIANFYKSQVKTTNSVYIAKKNGGKNAETPINKASTLAKQFYNPKALNYTTKPYTPKPTFNRTTI